MRGAKKYKAMNMKKSQNKSSKTNSAKEVPIVKDPMKNYRKRGCK